jgi:hypothetical protein
LKPKIRIADSTGLSLGVKPPGQPSVKLEGMRHDAGGISGRLFIAGLDNVHTLQAEIFQGFKIALTAFDLTLAHGGFRSSHIAGKLTIPYFTTRMAILRPLMSSSDSKTTARSR